MPCALWCNDDFRARKLCFLALFALHCKPFTANQLLPWLQLPKENLLLLLLVLHDASCLLLRLLLQLLLVLLCLLQLPSEAAVSSFGSASAFGCAPPISSLLFAAMPLADPLPKLAPASVIELHKFL